MSFSETTIRIAKLQLAGFTAVEIAKKLRIAKANISDVLWRIRGREAQIANATIAPNLREKRRMEKRLMEFDGTVKGALWRLSKVHNLETALELLGYRGDDGEADLELHLYTMLGELFDEYKIPKPSTSFSVEKLLDHRTLESPTIPLSQFAVLTMVLVPLWLHPAPVIPDNMQIIIGTPFVIRMEKTIAQTSGKIKMSKKIKKSNKVKVILHPIPIRYTALQVRGYITAALHITHEPRSWSKPLYWMAYQESRFYAHTIDGVAAKNVNLAGASQHAEGLMQVVPSTFHRHAIRGMQNIWNPVDNLASSIRYVVGRYGSPYKIPGVFQVNEYNGY